MARGRPLTSSFHKAGGPAGCASAEGWSGFPDVDPGSGEQPGGDRVGVPHLARVQFVASPDRRRHRGGEFEDATTGGGVFAEALGAFDGFGDVGYASVVPAADLVAKQGTAGETTASHRPFSHDATFVGGIVPDGCHLDDVPFVGDANFQRRVVEVAPGAVLEPRGDELERQAVQTYAASAGAERQPVEIHGRVAHHGPGVRGRAARYARARPVAATSGCSGLR